MKIPFAHNVFCLLLLCVAGYAYGNAAEDKQAGLFSSSASPVYVENRGQWNSMALFLAQTPGLDVWVTQSGVVYDMYGYVDVLGQEPRRRRGTIVTMEFLNALPSSVAEGVARQAGYYSYVRGKNCIADVGSFEQALLRQIYQRIDAVFYCEGKTSRYDFVVQPGGDYREIALLFHGAEDVALTKSGDLLVSTRNGVMAQRGLAAYQIIDGQRRSVECTFVLTPVAGKKVLSFKVGEYNRSYPLVIDPLVSGTFVGGSEKEDVKGIAVDVGGNAYVLGTTVSSDFPTTPGAYDTSIYNTDIFLTKFDYTGTRILFSTFIGGNGEEQARGLARDDFGSLYITGITSSSDIVDVSFSYPELIPSGKNVFVACLTSEGNALRYMTLLGGSSDDEVEAIAVDKRENVYIAGTTRSSDFPLFHSSEIHKGEDDVFFVSLDKKGERRFATLLGGVESDSGKTVVVDKSNNIWVAGHTTSKNLPTTDFSTYNGSGYNVFFSKWDSDGKRGAVGYIGSGAGNITAMATDNEGAIYLTGYTPDGSFTLPDSRIQPPYDKNYSGQKDGFILKLTTEGKPEYATFLGAAYDDVPLGIAVDADGKIIVVGSTTQSGLVDDFLPNSFFPRYSLKEGFVAILRPGETEFSYATYLGGSHDDECVAVTTLRDSTLFVVGNTLSRDFPVSLESREYEGSKEGFLVRLQYVPKLDVFPATQVVNFGKVYVGASAKESIAVRNRSSAFAELSSIRIARAMEFATNHTAPLSLPTGDTPLEFVFTPAKVGAAEDTVVLTAKYLKKAFTIILKGEGIPMPLPIVQVFPDTVDFGDVRVSSIATRSIVVTNAGVVPATVTSLTLSFTEHFVLLPTQIPFTLQPAQSQQIFVQCTPSTTGAIQATVYLEVARVTNAGAALVRANGVHTPLPVLSIPTSFDFRKVQVGSTKEWVPAILNTGTTSATLSLDVIPLDNFRASLSQSLVEPNSSVNMKVVFAPTTTGVLSQQIRVRAEEQINPVTIDVVGEGVLPYAQVTSAVLDFGRIRIGEQFLLSTPIYNRGIDTLRIASVISTHAFFQPDAVPALFPVAVHGEMHLPITFAPTQVGTFASIIWVYIANVPEPLPIRVTGIGIPADAAPVGVGVSPTLLNMGEVAVGSTVASSFDIYNRSTTQSVEVTSVSFAVNQTAFYLDVAQPTAFVLEKGERRSVPVYYNPQEIGGTSAVIRVQSTVNSVSVVVQGLGTSGTLPLADTLRVVLPSVQARIGEYVFLPLSFGNPEQDYAIASRRGIMGFRAVLRWNASIAQQTGGTTRDTVIAGERYVEIEAPLQFVSRNELYALPIRVLWGDAERTKVSIGDFRWLPASADMDNLSTITTSQGEIIVSDIWHDKDGPRLINSLKGIADVDINPNPFSDKTTITIRNATPDATVKIFDILGNVVLDLTPRMSKEHSVQLLSSELARGTYYCRIGTGKYALVRILVVR